jgi:hypothetical protein
LFIYLELQCEIAEALLVAGITLHLNARRSKTIGISISSKSLGTLNQSPVTGEKERLEDYLFA